MLYRGTVLKQAVEWSRRHAAEMSELEGKFVRASRWRAGIPRLLVTWSIGVSVMVFVLLLSPPLLLVASGAGSLIVDPGSLLLVGIVIGVACGIVPLVMWWRMR